MRMLIGFRCCLWLAALGSAALAAPGARREWVAHPTDSGNWSEPGNWLPAGAPQDGDVLIFQATAELPSPRKDMHNDLVNLAVRSILFCDHGWALDGNELTLLDRVGNATNPTPCGPISFTFDCPLKLGGTASMIIPEAGGTLILKGHIDLNGNDLHLISGEQIIVSSQIAGTGNVFATVNSYAEAKSKIVFDGPTGNTFSGRLTIRQIYNVTGAVVFEKQFGVVVSDAAGVVPTIRGLLGLPGPTAAAGTADAGDSPTNESSLSEPLSPLAK